MKKYPEAEILKIDIAGNDVAIRCPHCGRVHHHGIGYSDDLLEGLEQHRVGHCHQGDYTFKMSPKNRADLLKEFDAAERKRKKEMRCDGVHDRKKCSKRGCFVCGGLGVIRRTLAKSEVQ